MFFLSASLFFGADAVQSRPAAQTQADDDWNQFVSMLAGKYDAVAAECKQSGWPAAANVQPAYDDSVLGIIGSLAKRNGEVRGVKIYYVERVNVNAGNAPLEIEKMAAGLRNFYELARRMERRGCLLSGEQIDLVWSEEEISRGHQMAVRANELIDAYVDKWLELEPLLDTPTSRPYSMDGKKYVQIGLRIRNPDIFNASELWPVVNYPLEEINDKNLDEKVRDALNRITAYLTEKPYLKIGLEE